MYGIKFNVCHLITESPVREQVYFYSCIDIVPFKYINKNISIHNNSVSKTKLVIFKINFISYKYT